jgi:hypothetical protein
MSQAIFTARRASKSTLNSLPKGDSPMMWALIQSRRRGEYLYCLYLVRRNEWNRERWAACNTLDLNYVLPTINALAKEGLECEVLKQGLIRILTKTCPEQISAIMDQDEEFTRDYQLDAFLKKQGYGTIR